MTHAEWLAATDPRPMLEFLLADGRLTQRKDRLFACACCRRWWARLEGEPSRQAVQTAERFADGRASPHELADAAAAAGLALGAPRDPSRYLALAGEYPPEPLPAWPAIAVAVAAPGDGRVVSPFVAWAAAFQVGGDWEATYEDEFLALAALLRDIAGDPFLPPPAVAPAVLEWNAGMVVQLARSIYEQDRFGDLPALADALEEAGSTDAGLLAHFRGGGRHAKGCDHLDAVLGLR